MTRAIGAKARLILDEETAYGADPGAPDGKLINMLSTSINPEQNLIADESLRGIRDRVAPVQGNINVAGSIAVNLSETAHAWLLKHTFGTVVTTGAGDPWTHTMKNGDLPVGLVLNKEFTDIDEYHKFNGCRVASMELAATPEGFVTTTFNIIGQKETRSATPYDATPTTYVHEAFSTFQADLEQGGSPIGTITDLSFTVSNELDEEGFAIDGAATRRDLPEGDVVVTGSFEAFFEDDALLTLARAGTETSLKLTLDKGVSPARSIEFLIPEIKLSLSGPEIGGPTGIKTSFDFTAYYDDSSEATTIQAIVMNGLATL